MGMVRTGFDAGLTTDTFWGIDHAHIPVSLADMTSACRAIFHAQGLRALPAYGDLYVVGIAGKDSSAYLDPG